MSKPNIFIIGVQKAGTTSLYHSLRKHPELFGPEIKDYNNSHPFFINQNYFANKKNQYEKLFRKSNNKANIITSDVDLIEDKIAMMRIKEYSPNAKIIICLRNPIQRLKSMFKYYKQLGKIEESDSLETVLKANPETYMKRSLYFEKIKNAYEIFSENNIKIVLFEELIDEIKQNLVLEDLCEFLGVEKMKIEFLHENQTGKPIKNIFRKTFELGRGSKSRETFISLVDKVIDANDRTVIKKALFSKKTSKSTEAVSVPENAKSLIIEDAKKIKKRFNIDVLRH